MTVAYEELPDAPVPQPAEQSPAQPEQPNGNISGLVTDPSTAAIKAATVTLLDQASKAQRTLITDGNGFFNFTSLAPSVYKLTITSAGFAPYTSPDIALHLNASYDFPRITLHVAAASTNVEVTLSQSDIAEEQIKQQEQQRVIAIFPNFYVTYNWNAAPLTSKQKFKLAFRTTIDPAAFLGAGIAAGFEQSQNAYKDYGQGAAGYGKRFGASYGDQFDGTFIGNAILPSLFHQDPRYFYKGTGTTRSRIFYAISTAVICKGDNGKWQPNYSNILGSYAAAGISNAYYPADSRGATLVFRNASIGIASSGLSAIFQEFILKKISKGVPPADPGQPIWPGTPKPAKN
jgi:hypothetical protein